MRESEFEKQIQRLNSVSPSFCLAKWLQGTLHLQNGMTHCCHHPEVHKIDAKEIASNPAALLNTKKNKESRRLMLEGKRPADCSFCWTIEDLPGDQYSDRLLKSSDFSWVCQNDLEYISSLSWEEDVVPRYLEVSFSNKCNLKCSYCSPVNSSSWVKEVKESGPYIIHKERELNSLSEIEGSGKLPLNYNDKNPYVDAFWRWWPDLKKELKVFRITGGEPLVDRNTFRILENLIKNPMPELSLSINTNLSVNDDLIDKFLNYCKKLSNQSSVKNLEVFTSVDAHGEQAEYGRNGLSYQKLINNIEKLLAKVADLKVTIMCTTNIFSITSLGRLVEDIYSLKKKYRNKNREMAVYLDFGILRYPCHQSLSLLPNHFENYLAPVLTYIKERNINRVEGMEVGFCESEQVKFTRLIDFLKNCPQLGVYLDPVYARIDFYHFVNEHDRRRGTNFNEVFPELSEFYDSCKDEYINYCETNGKKMVNYDF